MPFAENPLSCASVSMFLQSGGFHGSGVVAEVLRRAAEAPNAVAVRIGNQETSFLDLVSHAVALAASLRSFAGPEQLIAQCLPRSLHAIANTLAIWMTGAALLPLDPAWPDERLRCLLADAQPHGVIGDAACVARLPGWDVFRSDLPDQWMAGPVSTEFIVLPSVDALAYVVYTSGSTGVPKGVEITHANLAALLDWHRNCFAVTATDRASHMAGLGFDAAFWEIWPNLAAGACVCIVDEDVRLSPTLLQTWLVTERISVAFVPTVLAEPMLVASWPAETALRLLLTGADTLHRRPPSGLPFTLVNNYGPTECTVVATSGAVLPDAALETTKIPGAVDLPTIGWPVAGARVHLLDPNGQEVPYGSPGEICIGGALVGRGYRNRPELTAQVFRSDPFAGTPGARLYHTGDIGQRRADGSIDFCGRRDAQVKIRGCRVELDEVAAVLDQHPLVAASVVAERDGRLLCYILPMEDSDEPDSASLHAFATAALPAAAVPGLFMRLEVLPLTPNGKLDRSALPPPGPENTLGHAAHRIPASPTERRIVAILAELLCLDEVGADDNFFLLGGHSLLGTQLVLRLREAFGVPLTLRHLFDAQTPANLAAIITELLAQELIALAEDAQRSGVSIG